jgi:hypothetical protein
MVPGMSKLTVTNSKEMNYKWPQPKDNFALAETPVIRVIGCEGKNISLQIIDILSGKIVMQRNEFFPKPTIVIGKEKIDIVHPDNDPNTPPILGRSTQIDVYKQSFFWSFNLPSGSYEAHLLVEGKLIEKSSFSISK